MSLLYYVKLLLYSVQGRGPTSGHICDRDAGSDDREPKTGTQR